MGGGQQPDRTGKGQGARGPGKALGAEGGGAETCANPAAQRRVCGQRGPRAPQRRKEWAKGKIDVTSAQ